MRTSRSEGCAAACITTPHFVVFYPRRCLHEHGFARIAVRPEWPSGREDRKFISPTVESRCCRSHCCWKHCNSRQGPSRAVNAAEELGCLVRNPSLFTHSGGRLSPPARTTDMSNAFCSLDLVADGVAQRNRRAVWAGQIGCS